MSYGHELYIIVTIQSIITHQFQSLQWYPARVYWRSLRDITKPDFRNSNCTHDVSPPIKLQKSTCMQRQKKYKIKKFKTKVRVIIFAYFQNCM